MQPIGYHRLIGNVGFNSKMETTERIVESYCRYVKGWFTIANIKCSGQKEIDLLAYAPNPFNSLHCFYIESGVSISGGFSKLTGKPFSENELKKRTKQAEQRRTIGYFIKHKFGSDDVIQQIKWFGFSPGQYGKIIVTWGWEDKAKNIAEENKIMLWDFRDILKEIADLCRNQKNTLLMTLCGPYNSLLGLKRRHKPNKSLQRTAIIAAAGLRR